MKWYHYIIIALSIFVAGIGTGLWLGSLRKARMPEQTHEVVHTEVITQWKERPRPVAISAHKTGKTDTIFVLKDSVIIRHDTIQVAIAREQKYYEDSLYKAWVSGINPRLDSISIASKTVNNYIPVRAYPVVHFGPSATYGYDPVRKQCAFVVGASLTVDLQELYKEIFDYRK